MQLLCAAVFNPPIASTARAHTVKQQANGRCESLPAAATTLRAVARGCRNTGLPSTALESESSGKRCSLLTRSPPQSRDLRQQKLPSMSEPENRRQTAADGCSACSSARSRNRRAAETQKSPAAAQRKFPRAAPPCNRTTRRGLGNGRRDCRGATGVAGPLSVLVHM